MKFWIVTTDHGSGVICAPRGFLCLRGGKVVRDLLFPHSGAEVTAQRARAFRFRTHRAAAREATAACGEVEEVTP